jgi:hypothetical protein
MQEILEHIGEKINQIGKASIYSLKMLQNKDIFTVLTVILVAFASFGFGRLSTIEEVETPVIVRQAGEIGQASLGGATSQGAEFVASRNGKKYFLPWCGGASSISPQNKISFGSEEEARKAGYTPAANCPGLSG